MSFYTDADEWPTRPPRTRRPPGVVDLTATIAVLVLLVLIAALLSFLVILEEMGVAACSALTSSCDYALLSATMWITPAVAVACIVMTLAALATRSRTMRYSWWVPLGGVVLTIIAFVVSSILVSAALITVAGVVPLRPGASEHTIALGG